MSPRAAWRLERLGFGAVYDYAAGKVDWIAAGLPSIRADTTSRRALDDADRNPPTCAPDDHVPNLAAPSNRSVIVVNAQQIILGRVQRSRRSEDAVAEAVMEPGPATVRAHEPLEPLLQRMSDRNVSEMIVSTPEGQLLGVIYRTFRPGED